MRPFHRQDDEREQQQECRDESHNVNPIRYFCSLFKSCIASVVCSLGQLRNRDTPSEYVQSVAGHGRQHDIFPTNVGVGKQRRPEMTRHVSISCHPRARDARRGTRRHTSTCGGKLCLLKERLRTVPLERHWKWQCNCKKPGWSFFSIAPDSTGTCSS